MTGMSAKTVKKILIRGRGDYLFGSRAWLSIRVDPRVFKELPPEPPAGIDSEGPFAGMFYLHDGGRVVEVAQLSSGVRPDDDDNHFIEERYGMWSWYEVMYYKAESPLDEHEHVDPFLSPDEELEFVNYMRGREAWTHRYVYGGFDPDKDEGMELLYGMYDASRYAKTLHVDFDRDGSAVITFVVKWFYPKRKFGFCRELAKWTKVLSKAEIPFRVLRGAW